MTTEETLLRMKNEIESAKTKKSRLEGELDSLNKQLFARGFSSLEEAENNLLQLEETIKTSSTEVREQVEALLTMYTWKTI